MDRLTAQLFRVWLVWKLVSRASEISTLGLKSIGIPSKNILVESSLIDETTKAKLIDEISSQIIPALTKEAEKVPVSESTIIATDWMNGRRTPDANQMLKGTITGLTLGSSAPRIFRALVEATAFGSKSNC